MYDLKYDLESSHGLLKGYLSKLPVNTKVLDVGTASGLLGKMLKSEQLHLFGIEPNEAWAKSAEGYYKKIYIGQLEEIKDEFLRNYNIIVCGDVLEHMVDPLHQLIRLVELQETNKVLVCVPNVANIWIRINLLFGSFDYSEKGIWTNLIFGFLPIRPLQN